MPWVSNASSAYDEQLGLKRHGERRPSKARWYHWIIRTARGDRDVMTPLVDRPTRSASSHIVFSRRANVSSTAGDGRRSTTSRAREDAAARSCATGAAAGSDHGGADRSSDGESDMAACDCGVGEIRAPQRSAAEPHTVTTEADEDVTISNRIDQADRRARPLARRALSTARPPRVLMRARKPCVLARRRAFG